MKLLQTEGTEKLHWYHVVIGIAFLAIQHGAYLLGHIIASLIGLPAYCSKIPAIDNAFPIVSVFIIIYIISYPYWAVGPIVVAKCKKEHYLDFMAAFVACLVLGIIILALAPTYMDRNAEHLFDTDKTDIFTKIRQFWYTLDGDQIAYNLLPSFHCSNSTLCYLGVSRRKEVPLIVRILFLVLTILVFFSTLYVKQHYFLDVLAGIAIASVSYYAAKKFHWGRMFYPLISKINAKSNKEVSE